MFSSDEASAMEKRIDSHPLSSSRLYRKNCLESYYEIHRCARFALDGGYKTVALQFPDFLLCDSVWVVSQLSQQCPCTEFFILGDTSYGSCCVDEVAAEHSSADCIIHFGPSCLTRTKRLPVLYVFGCEEIDVDHCAASLKTTVPDRQQPLLLLYDVGYTHAIENVQGLLEDYPHIVISTVVPPPSPSPLRSPGDVRESSASTTHQCSSEREKCECVQTTTPRPPASESIMEQDSQGSPPVSQYGRVFTLQRPIEEYSIFYIGYESLTMSHLIMNYSSCKFYSYNPISKKCQLEGAHVNKVLGRRYYLIQRAKEAGTVGILVGTLGAADYLDMIEHLKKVIKSAGKKYYTVAMGKLNPAKMANFMEVDIYVLVACPENSLVDSKEFFKPVITPYELEVACIRKREWLGQVVSDFHKLLPGGTHHETIEAPGSEEKVPEYSFISAKMVSLSTDAEDDSLPTNTELAEKKEEDMKVGMYTNSAAANYLQTRSWRGLEPKLGETPVSKITLGQSGLPIHYSEECKLEGNF